MKWLIALLDSIFSVQRKPVFASGDVLDPNIMFARRPRRDDDYADSEETPSGRKRKIGERSMQRFGGATGSRGKKDIPMIIGIIVGIIVVLGLGFYFMRPSKELEIVPTSSQGFKGIRTYAKDIFYWKQKFSSEKLFPMATDGFLPEDSFFKEFSEHKLNPDGGFYYYYSVSPDRKKFSLACEPVDKGSEYCFCAVAELDSDIMFYEAKWEKKGDMEIPVSGNQPSLAPSTFWSEKDPSSVPSD